MKHKHAELMMQYAQDAMEMDKPWERWEMKYPTEKDWLTLDCNPLWQGAIDYRRKPKMLSVTLVSGEVVSWPEPHRTELEYGDSYFYVDVDGSVIVGEWDCLSWDRTTLSNGYIHLTKEAAEQHAAALHKINTQGKSK